MEKTLKSLSALVALVSVGFFIWLLCSLNVYWALLSVPSALLSIALCLDNKHIAVKVGLATLTLVALGAIVVILNLPLEVLVR